MAEVMLLEHSLAKSFIERWHYSGRCPTGKNIFFGGYLDGELYCVADYGIGVNAYQARYLARETGLPVTSDTLLELKRLCRTEPKRGWPLTAFMAACHRHLRLLGYRYIVSFSDPEQGHSGGIYRAANFTHLGQTAAEFHVIDKDGEKRHRRYPFRHARRNGISIAQAREELGLVRVKTQPKDRWFLPLDRRAT